MTNYSPEPTRILVGSPVKQDPEVFRAHVRTLEAQDLPDRTEVEYAFVLDDDRPEIRAEMERIGATILDAPPKPESATYSIDEITHRWSKPTFHWLATAKQQLLDYAVLNGFDFFFLVDSDLLLSTDTLRSLLRTRCPLVSAVFWTHWAPSQPPLPQVWLRHPYRLDGRGMDTFDFLRRLETRQCFEVTGGGACMLMGTEALRRGVRYSPILEGLPEGGMWQGEDRSFAIRAQRLHVPMHADAWPDLVHLYHPEQRKPEYIEAAFEWLEENKPLDEPPSFGDLVSFTVDPIEDSRLSGALEEWPEERQFRCRFGALDTLPQIESTLGELRPGEDRILNVPFPHHWPVPGYAGSERAVRVRLVSAKRNILPPIRGEYLRGEDR